MKHKLSILIAILISIAPVLFFTYNGIDLKDYWYSILRATIVFVISALIIGVLVFFLSKKVFKTISFILAYNLSGSLQIVIVLAILVFSENSGTKGFESIRTGDDKDYEFSSKEYYLDTGEIKYKTNVKVRDNKGDSIVTHYSKSGEMIEEKIYKVDK